MTKAAETVLAEALRLDLDARAEVADPAADAAWALEIERRVAAIEAGTVTLEPWNSVKHRIERQILGR
jgi:hypothetical protein